MDRSRKAVRRNPAPGPDRRPDPAVTQEISQRLEVFSGPLPPPETLKVYNEAHPDAADRILRMAEEQGKHRRTAEAAIIEKELIRAQRGQTFGFVIAMMALVGGIVLLFFDKNIQGFSSIAIGLVTAFTVGRFSQARERRQKAKSEH